MERIIAGFVKALRERGVRVSQGESLDAVEALSLGGFDGRDSMRAYLCLTLIKNVNDIPAFEEVFDRFFSRTDFLTDNSDPLDLLGALIHIVEGEQLKSEMHQTHHEEGPNLATDGDLSAEELENLMGMAESDDDSEGAQITVQLDGFRGKMEAPMPSDYYQQAPPTVAFHQSWQAKSRIDLVSAEEQAEMQDVVGRMLMRIRKDVQRMKEEESRGKLHVIKTLQKNYRHDMVPFLRSLRRKRKEKPRLVVFCDVSYSVSHATRFLLLLLHTLQNRVMDVRSFVFNSEIAEITEKLRNMPINVLLETMDRGEIVNLDDNSDYGKVFTTFKEKYLEGMRGKPAIVVLGDGRNNYHESEEWALEEIREKAGYLLWLTPEDEELWGRGDCLLELYGEFCDEVKTVKSVEELGIVVEDLFCTLYDHNDTRAWRR
ncbi:VWA domain-containing protein, partial [Geomonas sp.]|uniref:VWA domain-containing protein n=1 Tax=Geomonas sp. TaxID=2651584 RepID=UPI002B458F67